MYTAQRHNVNTTASATAHSAATQAFLASRQSTPNLSASAAAAAALRTMSPPPTDVSQVQTKRTLQRQVSTSSTGSPGRGRGGPALRRQGSSGSMTERTFRTPSPNRPGSRGGPVQAPPVPQLPQDYKGIPAKTHRRAISMEPLAPRVVSPPSRPAGRGQSLDRTPAPVVSKTAPKKTADTPSMYQLERTDSQSSINFSYPRNARPNSPPARSPASPPPGQHPFPKTMRTGPSATSSEAFQYDLTRVSEQPVKKKKPAARISSEGSHFRASADGPAVTAPLEPVAAVAEPVAPAPVRKKKKKPIVTGQTSHFPDDPATARYSSDSDSTSESLTERERRSQRAAGTLYKRPSIVREDWEGEQSGQPTQANKAKPAAQKVESESTPVGSPIAGPVSPPRSKKPSTAANVSRKIDEGASSPKAAIPVVHDAVTILPPQPQLQAQPEKHLAVTNESPVTRTASLSPSRATRFSDRLSSDLAAGRKHEPLPRSVSPVKSALKQHSPSPRPRSPVDSHLPPHLQPSSQTPSEASDTNSLLSADGQGGSVKKKKAARVSFEPDPEVVGVAATALDADTPALPSPQTRDAPKKGWFGFGKTKQPELGTIPAEDEIEDLMTPRPALPSFGSIRSKGRNVEIPAAPLTKAAAPQKSVPSTLGRSQGTASKSSGSSETSSGSIVQTLDTPLSSDHAIGNVLAQEANRQKITPEPGPTRVTEPLPPEVTSVEGTGYASDSESSDDEQENKPVAQPPPQPAQELHPHTPSLDAPSANGRPLEQKEVAAAAAVIPVIAVHPATPALGETVTRDQPDQFSVKLPGGFPSSTSRLPTPEPQDGAKADLKTTPPTGLAITEPQPLTEALLEKHTGVEEDSDHDSIYSDAAESQADLEGDGFGSINAIVDSPVVPVSVPRLDKAPESPLQPSPTPGRTERTQPSSWESAQAHWSGVAESYRQGVQPQPRPQPRSRPQSSPPERAVKPAQPKAQQPSRGPGPAAAAAAAKGLTAQPPSPRPASPRLAAPQRPSSPPRTLAPSPNIQTAAAPKLKGTLQKKRIPSGHVPAENRPPASPAVDSRLDVPATRPQPLPRTTTDDSDSSSSFKRRRRADSGGKYVMRRSMRTGPNVELAGSPAGSPRRPMSPGGGFKAMRTTMRNSMDSAPTSRRDQFDATRSSSLFGRKKKSAARPSSAQPLTSRIKSRLADSDDEDGPVPRVFRSRFEDSSDEEAEPVKLRPVRGIPRKQDEGDSTDLEDSSEDEAKGTTPATPPKPDTKAIPAGGSVPVPQSPVVSTQSEQKRRSFFSRFRSKKVKDANDPSRLGTSTIAERDAVLAQTRTSVEAARDAQYRQSTESKTQEGKMGKSNLGFASAAERDAMIEQTRARLEEAKEAQGEFQRPTSPTTSGKLQRRAQPHRIMSDSWPLPPRILDSNELRPSTSDGLNVKASETNQRRGFVHASSTLRTQGDGVAYGRSGRKKRFPWLRKAFGLTD